MTAADRARWDDRYARLGLPSIDAVTLPAPFAPYVHAFPTTGRALDVACGQGLGAVWLAQRGLEVHGVDVSTVAIEQAQQLARRSGVGDRCRFDVVDLDSGLPGGPPVDVVLCHRFRDRRLDEAIVGLLAPGGLVAITVLSEVGAEPGPHRAEAGELAAAFAALSVIAAGQGEGEAWILATA